jgi:hypothetical protein
MKLAENIPGQPSYEELLAENRALKEAVAELRGITALQARRIKELESRLSQDSHNRSKPPSSDRFSKGTKSQRARSNKPSGGHKGPQGETLQMVAEPDEVAIHTVTPGTHCGAG